MQKTNEASWPVAIFKFQITDSIKFFLASLFATFLVGCHSSVRPIDEQQWLLPPTGIYQVGFQDYRFVNGTLISGSYSCPGNSDLYFTNGLVTTNDFGPDNQVDYCREMMVRVYYPIKSTKGLPYANYYTPTINDFQNAIRDSNIPGITENQLEALNNIQTFTINFTTQNSNIVNTTFPVLIFSPGFGAQAQEYENITTNMASHGYIVLAINNTFLADIQFPYGLLPTIDEDISGLLIAEQSILNDILFTKQKLLDPNGNFLPEFINHMQLNRVGLLGHSDSGNSVVEVVRTNPSLFQAASYLDIAPFEFGTDTYSPAELAGFNTPFLRFNAASWNNPYLRDFLGIPLNVQFQLLDNNYFALLSPSIANVTYGLHNNFTDLSTLQYQPTMNLWVQAENSNQPLPDLPALQIGTGNGWYVAKIINEYLLAFFDQYLKNIPSSNLKYCRTISPDSILQCGS